MTDKNGNTGDCNTGNRNTGNRNTGSWNTGSGNSGRSNSGHRNSGDCNSGDCNSGDWNTGDRNTGDRNTGGCNTGDWNTGDRNTGSGNTGSWNTGSWNVGFFNTDTPDKIRAFNRDCDRVQWDGLEIPDWLYHPSPSEWVSDIEMTDEEKSQNPTFQDCGGYIRVNDWREEWRKAFDSASLEDVQKVRDLPNFDYAIFEEITGLDLSENSAPEQVSPKFIEIDGVKYRLELASEGESE